jgi:hypothetical protein
VLYDYQYEILNKPENKLKIRGNKMAKSKTSPKKPPMSMPGKKKGAC